MEGKTRKGQVVRVHSYEAASDSFKAEFPERHTTVQARLLRDSFQFTVQGQAGLAPLSADLLQQVRELRAKARTEVREAGYFEKQKVEIYADQPIQVEKVVWIGRVEHGIETPSSPHYPGKPIEELLSIELVGQRVSYFEALRVAQAEQIRLDAREAERKDELEAQDRVLRFIESEEE